MLSDLEVLAERLRRAEDGLTLHEKYMDRLSRRFRAGEMNFQSDEQVTAEFKAAETELYERRKEVVALTHRFGREALRAGGDDLAKAQLCAAAARKKIDKLFDGGKKGPSDGAGGGGSGIGGDLGLWGRGGAPDEFSGR